MITKICPKCGVGFQYEPPKNFTDNRKYCDTCKAINDAAYKASQNQPSSTGVPIPAVPDPVKPGEIAAETGDYQSTVWNHTVAANSYKWGVMGKAGQKFFEHKVYYETIEELDDKIKALGGPDHIYVEEEFKPERVPYV